MRKRQITITGETRRGLIILKEHTDREQGQNMSDKQTTTEI